MDSPLFVLNLSFHVVDGIGGFNLKCDGLSSECLHEDLHVEIWVESDLDVVRRE